MTEKKLAKAMHENRVAEVWIDAKLMRNEPDLVADLLSGCLIVESRPRFNPLGTSYVLFSPAFDPLEDGIIPPRVGVKRIEGIRPVHGSIQQSGGTRFELIALEFEQA